MNASEHPLAAASRPSLLIRADASSLIGTGHVMRCLALAQAWQDTGGVATIAAAQLPEPLEQRLASEGVALCRLREIPGSTGDAAATIAAALSSDASWIVVDGDRFGDEYLAFLHKRGARVALIDDFCNRFCTAVDLIVNPNIGMNCASYPGRKPGATLAGTPYVLLRREFQQAPKKALNHKGNRIFLALGGADPENMAPRIAEALACDPELHVTLVIGAANPRAGELQSLSADNVEILQDPPHFASLISDSDIAIIVAGGTLWELLAMGCPVLTYWRNSLQMNVVRLLSEQGIVRDMGDVSLFDAQYLRSTVRALADSRSARTVMSLKGGALIDGAGALRVVSALKHFEA